MKSKVSIVIPVYNVEQYIEKMLLSVERQEFKDWEAIIINDGSTDSSQRIIDDFVNKDRRFKSFIKDNGGVSSARNMGIDLASGEYVVFYDPDDYIPKNSLKHLYNKAKIKNADMVVGVMEEINLGDHLIYMHSQKLAKQNIISPIDKHFFGAWSVCNKMFSLNFIRENHIKFDDLSNAEDGVFTFEILKNEPIITGCDKIAYNYLKRPFWLKPSATQNISIKYLNGLLASHDRILESAKILAKKTFGNNKKDCDKYLEDLYIRFIEGEIINGFYRRIWRAGEDADIIYKTISERYNSYLTHISKTSYEKLIARHRDINLEEGIKSQEEIALNPLISVIITSNLAGKRLKNFMDSLYNQLFSFFEVYINNNNYKTADAITNIQNIHILDEENEAEFIKNAIKKSKGKYLIFAKDQILYSKNTLKNMVNIMQERDDLDFATTLIKYYDGNSRITIPRINGQYNIFSKTSRINRVNFTNSYVSNKLLRKTSISKNNMKYIKIRRGSMISLDPLNSNLLRENAPNKGVLAKSKIYDTIDAFANKLKRVITREDIDRVKGIFGIKK